MNLTRQYLSLILLTAISAYPLSSFACSKVGDKKCNNPKCIKEAQFCSSHCKSAENCTCNIENKTQIKAAEDNSSHGKYSYGRHGRNAMARKNILKDL
jgi:hypothetical protein